MSVFTRNMNPAFLFLLLVSVLASHAQAEEEVARVTSAQCASEQSPWRDFDFFVGHWQVFDPDSGQKYGENIITTSEQGCLLMGQWSNVNGVTGSSMNFYDPLQEKWRQVWQNAQVFVDQSGQLDEQGRMQMSGTIYIHASGVSAPFRGTWTPVDENRFLQEFWRYESSSELWTFWFRGEYRRKPEA